MRIYIANLPFTTSEEEVREKFEEFGRVESVNIIEDHATKKSRGFGFIFMPVFSEARAAVEGLNGMVIGDRTVEVSRAKPQNPGNNRTSYGKKRTGSSRGFGGRGFGGGRMKLDKR